MTKQKEMIRKSIEEHVELCLKASGGLPSETFSRSISYSLVELLDCLGVDAGEMELTILLIRPVYDWFYEQFITAKKQALASGKESWNTEYPNDSEEKIESQGECQNNGVKEVNMWRPKNWKNPFWNESYSAYEAGADAMLKALKEQGTFHVTEGAVPEVDVIVKGCGWLVFIPEEDK